MGQIFAADNIPNAVRASGTQVTLAATNGGQPTRITLGGQQYALSSGLTLTTSGTGANGLDTGTLGAIQLWYVYAIVNSSTFAPALVASQAAPTAGPAMPSGYGTAFKLVGAFYTDGSNLVGSMVSVVGPAVSTEMTYTGLILGAASNPTFSYTVNNTSWRRNGAFLEIQGQLNINVASSAGSGAALVSLPAGLSADNSRIVVNNVSAVEGSGIWYKASTTTPTVLTVLMFSSTQVAFTKTGVAANTGTLQSTDFSSVDQLGFKVSVPISGWSATLL